LGYAGRNKEHGISGFLNQSRIYALAPVVSFFACSDEAYFIVSGMLQNRFAVSKFKGLWSDINI